MARTPYQALAAEPGAAADAEAALERAVLLPVPLRRPDERSEDDDRAHDADEQDDDADRGLHIPSVPTLGDAEASAETRAPTLRQP